MGATVTPAPLRFWPKVDKSEGCWNWTAAGNGTGYGVFWDGKKNVLAHRFSYEMHAESEIPEGLVIDHLCRNRSCIRPDHLEVVTQRVNLLRGETITADQVLRTHCPQGHVYDELNTIIRRGKRECRTCANSRARAYSRTLYETRRKSKYSYEIRAIEGLPPIGQDPDNGEDN